MYPHQAAAFTKIGRERGWGPYTPEQFERGASPPGALFVGFARDGREDRPRGPVLGSRFQLKYAVGTCPTSSVL